uniref:Uncharacterized protein n=1 Tax=Eutreptiella gymnastica TaxID=73025 RepID=A0A7S4CX66_9EUGL
MPPAEHVRHFLDVIHAGWPQRGPDRPAQIVRQEVQVVDLDPKRCLPLGRHAGLHACRHQPRLAAPQPPPQQPQPVGFCTAANGTADCDASVTSTQKGRGRRMRYDMNQNEGQSVQ